jgi:hypothetical protein
VEVLWGDLRLGQIKHFRQQVCQICHGTTYQNGKTIPIDHKVYEIATKYMDQMAIKYTNIFHCKILQIYPNWDFWFENIASGNADTQVKCKIIWLI